MANGGRAERFADMLQVYCRGGKVFLGGNGICIFFPPFRTPGASANLFAKRLPKKEVSFLLSSAFAIVGNLICWLRQGKASLPAYPSASF